MPIAQKAAVTGKRASELCGWPRIASLDARLSSVEPQVSFSSTSSGGSTETFFWFAGQVGYLFTPTAKGSGYVAANGAFQTASLSGTSVSGPGFGGAVGYRVKVKPSLAIRLDGRYRRWFSDFKDMNEIGFSLGLGAIF